MIDVHELTDRTALDQLLLTQPLSPFLQSWAWGEFQAGLGRRIWRLGAYDHDQLVGAALVIGHQLILGKSYLYCPRPLADSAAAWQSLATAIADLGRQENVMYVKIDPGLYHFPWTDISLPDSFVPGTTLQPRHTRLIDTGRPLDEMLAESHQKTRYNIRLAERHDVTVRWSTAEADLDIFLSLMQQTYARQEIRLHPISYYRREFAILAKHQMVELALAEFQKTTLVANMIIWHGQTATYLYGGSSDEHKEVMAPHLVQWRTIERAHDRGITTYDLWGVTPADKPDHRWQGVSRFKRGLAGRDIEFPHSVNSILQPQWYQTYRWAKRFRGGVDE